VRAAPYSCSIGFFATAISAQDPTERVIVIRRREIEPPVRYRTPRRNPRPARVHHDRPQRTPGPPEHRGPEPRTTAKSPSSTEADWSKSVPTPGTKARRPPPAAIGFPVPNPANGTTPAARPPTRVASSTLGTPFFVKDIQVASSHRRPEFERYGKRSSTAPRNNASRNAVYPAVGCGKKIDDGDARGQSLWSPATGRRATGLRRRHPAGKRSR